MALICERLKKLVEYNPATGVFVWKVSRGRAPAGSVCGSVHNAGYLQIRIDGQRYLAHRLAVFYMTGAWPEHVVDHADQNRVNNAWNNLREATRAQNAVNAPVRRDNKLGLRGVRPQHGKWTARIIENGKEIHLGTFEDAAAAATAYDVAAARVFGEYARLNSGPHR